MWEFFTEWSENDPKWIVVFIIVGGWISWTGYRDYKRERKNTPFKMTAHNTLNMGRDIGGFLLFLVGTIELLRRLYLVIF